MTIGTGGTSNSMRPHIDQITAAIPRELARGVAPRLHAAVAKTLPPNDSFGNLISDALTPIIIEIAKLKREINELRSKTK
jgi:hypothetical protein